MNVAVALGMFGAAMAQTPLEVARYEGDWYIADTTDNISGEREVYAMSMHLKSNDPNFVTVRMKCVGIKPILSVEWEGQVLPDQTVLTISPAHATGDNSSDKNFIFQGLTENGSPVLQASAEVSQSVVSTIGLASYTTITLHPSAGSRTVDLSTEGTPAAWARVARNCPVKKMPLPPK